MNGKELSFNSQLQLLDAFRALRVGDEVELRVVREGKEITVELVAIAMPPELEAAWRENYEVARRHDAQQRAQPE